MTPIVGTPSTPEATATPAAPKASPLAVAVGLGLLAALGVLLYDRFGSHTYRAAKAVVTAADGKPVPASVAPDSVVVLSSLGSTASAVRWDVPDPEIVPVPLPVPGYFAFSVGKTPRVIRGSLLAVAGGTLDEAPISLVVGNVPVPGPSPGPTPAPGPSPAPEPVGDVDAELRRLAAAYYADSPSAYLAVPATLAGAAVPDYNAVTSAIGARHSAVANALGTRIDAMTAESYGPDLAYKDPAAARALYAKIGNSLRAGLRDAASQPTK